MWMFLCKILSCFPSFKHPNYKRSCLFTSLLVNLESIANSKWNRPVKTHWDQESCILIWCVPSLCFQYDVPLCPYHPWLLWVIIWCVPSFYFRFQPIRTHLFSRDIGRIMDHTYLPIRAYGIPISWICYGFFYMMCSLFGFTSYHPLSRHQLF